MEIIQKKVTIKLDQDERDTLIGAIDLIERISNELIPMCGEDCPFKATCDKRSDATCFFNVVAHDLRYINNDCD